LPLSREMASGSAVSLAAGHIAAALSPSLLEYKESLATLQSAQDALTRELTGILQRVEEHLALTSSATTSTAEMEAATTSLTLLLRRQAALKASLSSTEQRLLRIKDKFDNANSATAPS
jgi:chromosome segregation ATPase